jgi:hypothetical protein
MWVKIEALAGADRNALVPIVVDDDSIPLSFGHHHAVDFKTWNGETHHPAAESLFAAIEPLVKKPQSEKWRHDTSDPRYHPRLDTSRSDYDPRLDWTDPDNNAPPWVGILEWIEYKGKCPACGASLTLGNMHDGTTECEECGFTTAGL